MKVTMEVYACSWQPVKFLPNTAKNRGINLHNNNFSLSYETNIPRQTGLSGSSAIVCAAFSCLVDFYKVRDKIGVEIRPQLILNAEKKLGIVAGLQDRVAQVYGGLVYMDFEKSKMDECGHGIYTQLDTSLLPPLHLSYAENPSDSGKVHSTVRQRWLDGDKFIISSMEKVANLALEGKTALLEKDYVKFATLMNQNFDLRRRMFGDAALGGLNIEMVEVGRRVGAATKFTGSGGAVVAFCPEGPSQVKLLEKSSTHVSYPYFSPHLLSDSHNLSSCRNLSHNFLLGMFLQHNEFSGSIIFLADLQLSDLFGGNMFDRGDMV
ncbi:hypothetical protein LXL04_010865 [Taraxacum kok-saghyz]